VYFGATSFAAAAFSDVGFNPNAFVNVLTSVFLRGLNDDIIL
jgi:hypothetical protein